MPEGDTILWAATRMRPVLEGFVPDAVEMPSGRPGALRGSPGRARWPERLRGRAVERIDTHGKNLFVRFEGDLVLHSHLRMTGAWGIYAPGARWSRSRFDLRLAALGPDVLAPEFDYGRFLARLRQDDPSRPIGDAVLDQRTVAGIGNIWKSEGCWEAGISPWRRVREVTDAEATAIIDGARPRMLRSGTHGPRFTREHIYRKERRPCPRCGRPIEAAPQGDGNRITYWCPGCQT
jgi:endonuclease-8